MKKLPMPKLIAGALAAAALAVIAGLASSARAEEPYRWCAEYGGRGGSGTNCGFETLAQCRATISGNGGTCYENPDYGTASKPKKRAPAQR